MRELPGEAQGHVDREICVDCDRASRLADLMQIARSSRDSSPFEVTSFSFTPPLSSETAKRRSGFVDLSASLSLPPHRPRLRSLHPPLRRRLDLSILCAPSESTRDPRVALSPAFTIMFDTAASARPGSGGGPCSFSAPRCSCCTTRPPQTFPLHLAAYR